MKNMKPTVSALLILSSFLFSNCTQNIPFLNTTKEIITQNEWSVNYYFDGQDNTAQFHGYQFDFSSNGTLTCTNGTDTITGSWSATKDASQKDVLTMSLDDPQAVFTDLNYDWSITTVNLSSIAMKNSSNTQLVLQKL